MTRTVATAVLAAALAGCLPHTSPYSACKQDSDCAGAGASAKCEPNGACALPADDCASGYKYAGSAPTPNTCVPGGSSADAGVDASGTPDAMPLPAGRECIPGRQLPSAYSACAAKVDAKEPRCGTQGWDDLCVRWAVTQCEIDCSPLMAFVGATSPFVIRLSDNAVVWQDPNSYNGFAGAWGDFDNDGFPDLAIAGYRSLHVFRNAGYVDDPTSPVLTLTPVQSVDWATLDPQYQDFNGTDVRWVDIDQDGLLDVMFAGYGGVIELRNMGNGVFEVQPPLLETVAGADTDAYPIQPSAVKLAWGDYDGNGYPDLAISRSGESVVVYDNDHGTLTLDAWQPSQDFDPVFGNGIEWCNLAGDAHPELVVSGNDYAAIVPNNGGVLSTTLTPIDSDDGSTDIRCADLDLDGDLDLVSTGDDGDGARAFVGSGSLQTISQTWVDTNAATDARPEGTPGIADLDGDHKLDVLTAFVDNPPTIELQVFHNTSITNKVQFTPTTHTVLSNQMQGAGAISIVHLAAH